MNQTIPAPPPGFQIVGPQEAPPPPPGFRVVEPGASTAPEPTLVDRIMAGADTALGLGAAGADGFRQGVSQLVGMPVDLVNQIPRVLNILPGEQGFTTITDNPIGGSQSVDRSLRGGTVFSEPVVPDYAPQGLAERLVNRVGEEVGANAVPLTFGLRAANRLGVEGARGMAGPVGRYVEALAVNPAKTAGKEMGYAVAAGTGAGAAREAYSDGDPNTTTSGEAIADLLGSFGGMAGLGLVEGLGRASVDASKWLFGGDASTATRDMVAGILAREAGAPTTQSGARDTSGLAAILARGSRMEEVAPGFRPSTGDVLGNTAVQNLEYSRQAGSGAGAFAARRAGNDAAVARAMDEVQPTSTPGAFSETLRINRDQILQEAEVAAIEARQKFEDAVTNLQAVQSGEARGQTIRAALDEALGAAREVERSAWSKVQGDVDPAGLGGAIDQVTQNLTLAERDAVADIAGTLDIPNRLMPDDEVAGAIAGTGVDVGEITGMRSALTTAARQAEAAGDPNKARIIGRYVEAIDGFLDGVPGLSDALTEARAVSRDLNDRFTRRGSPVADTLAARPSGGPAVPDSQVAPKFIQPDSRQASVIEDVLRETGPTNQAAAAREALRDQILADVGRRGLLDKPDQLRDYLSQYGQVFEKYPDLKQELGTAAGLRENLSGAEKGWTETAKALGGADGRSGTSAVAKYLRYGDERAKDAMQGVVSAPDPAAAADELLRFAGDDPAAIEGAKSAFWSLMTSKARSVGTETRMADGAQRWRPQSLKAFIDDPANAAVMERLYADNPEHLERIRMLADELSRADMRVTQRAPATSGSPQQKARESIVPSTETLGAYSFAYQRGQIGLPFIGLRLASTMARKAMLKGHTGEFERLLDEALLNPEIAELLLRENNPANVKALAGAAKGVLGVRSAWIDDVLDGDEPAGEDDEVLGAIGQPEQPRFNLPDVNLPTVNEDILRQFGRQP